MQQDASGATAGSMVGNTTAPLIKMQSKNGNLFTDSMKESVIIAATKQLTKKDKRGSNATVVSIDASDATYLEKASPSLQMKRKSSSVDITSNGPSMTNIDHVQLSTFANGNPVINEESGKPSPTSANGDYATIDGNLTDSDLSSIISEHPTVTAATTTNNNIQISQV